MRSGTRSVLSSVTPSGQRSSRLIPEPPPGTEWVKSDQPRERINPHALSSRRKHGKSRQIVANETRKLRASHRARAAGISQAMRYDSGARKRPTVEIIDSTEAPVGLGEPGTTVVASATGNAIFAAVGIRLRHLPIRPSAVIEALASQGRAH
jgi:hypothetical protein